MVFILEFEMGKVQTLKIRLKFRIRIKVKDLEFTVAYKLHGVRACGFFLIQVLLVVNFVPVT